MTKTIRFNVHGDNIIECERFVSLSLRNTEISAGEWDLETLSCPSFNVSFQYRGESYQFKFVLYPGFNKNTKKRWGSDVFSALHQNGSYLDETPDAILTKYEDGREYILAAIEFCSALQAGNQAWQRSGRAFSTGRTGCPYLYIVDFVKYELDSETRKRKALRFPNPAVPYSYISYSKATDSFVVQAYVKSEEFQKQHDSSLKEFDEKWFSEIDISDYLLEIMLGIDTTATEKQLLDKNYNVVGFLAKGSSSDKFNENDWFEIYHNNRDLNEYVKQRKLRFFKKIAEKSSTGKTTEFNNLVKQLGIGYTSADLPFGIIPASKRKEFVERVARIFPELEQQISILDKETDLIVCLIKGFKPRGDDNRPDRGILPLATMLSGTNTEILTYIYGPLINANYRLLEDDPYELSQKNGLWRSILSLTNYLLVDSPIINGGSVQAFYDNRAIKTKYNSDINKGDLAVVGEELSIEPVPPHPINYREDDVDTIIHELFKNVFDNDSFECMCNPPGGDWSGLSIIENGTEYRWLSLPRAPEYKRPDHVIELTSVMDRKVLLCIESKETEDSLRLEENVGLSLKQYLGWLMNHTPSVKKQGDSWDICGDKVDINNYELVSSVAYISAKRSFPHNVFDFCKCDLILTFKPSRDDVWELCIFSNSPNGDLVKKWIINQIKAYGVSFIRLINN